MSPPSIDRDYGVYSIMREACGARQDAYTWWVGVQDIASHMDAVADSEPIDKTRSLQALSAVVLGWPTIRFYVEHSGPLALILTCVWHSWQASDRAPEARVKAWDVTVETGKAVLFLLGGTALVDRYARQLHDAVIENMKGQV